MRYALAMRIALYGGSFNPPHLGHELAALYVLETAGVDELWLVPCFKHPFEKTLEPFEDRLAMCRLAAGALGPRARVTDIERELGGESRTLRTVRALQARHPEHRFELVIGADLVAETATWYGAEELQKTVPFIVVGRAGLRTGAGPRPGLEMPAVSSTEIRKALGEGKPVNGLVSRAILGYIRERRLFRAEPTAGESPVVFPVVFIMGAGVVGTTLAVRLARAGVTVAGLHGRQVGPSGAASELAGVPASSGEIPLAISTADVVIIAVRDDRIGEVAERLVREKRLRREQVVLHTSGAHASAQALGIARPHVAGVGTLHPLVSFADPLIVEEMKTFAFAIEGDEPARAAAGRLVLALGAGAVFLTAETLPLYHAGAVIASNYVVALAAAAERLLVEAGVPQAQALPALIPLLSSVVENLSQLGLPGALTGPVARGDVSSVEQHLRVLEERAPEMLDLYRGLGRDVLRLAREKSPLEPATLARLEALFQPVKESGQ